MPAEEKPEREHQLKNNIAFPIIIKRSPIHLGIQALFVMGLSVLALILLIVLSTLASTSLDITPFTIPIFTIGGIVLIILNAAVVLYGVFIWNSESYEIRPEEIVQTSGVFTKKRRGYPIGKVETINLNQSFLGKTFDYGTITLLNPVLPENRTLNLVGVPQPQKYIDLIKQIQATMIEGSAREGSAEEGSVRGGNVIYREKGKEQSNSSS